MKLLGSKDQDDRFKLILSIVMLNVDGLNVPVKKTNYQIRLKRKTELYTF